MEHTPQPTPIPEGLPSARVPRGGRWALGALAALTIVTTGLIAADQLLPTRANDPAALPLPADGATSRLTTAPDGEGAKGVHDFGVVTAGGRYRHRFTVRNDGASTWKLRNVETACACTVPMISKEVIRPGEEFDLTVQYTAPQREYQDTRTVTANFDGAPFQAARFTLKATVRQYLSVSQDRLDVRVDRHKQAVVEEVVVRNYSEKDWDGIAIKPNRDWLTAAEARPEPKEAEMAGARQAWRVRVAVDSGKLLSGENSAVLLVQGGNNLTRTIAVVVTFERVVRCAPGQIFIGAVGPGAVRTAGVTLIFSPEAFPATADDLTVTHDLGEAFSVRVTKFQAPVVELVANFAPAAKAAAPATVNGLVTVMCAADRFPTTTVPVSARVVRP